MNHPEIDGPLGDALADFNKMELVDVWCNGCGAFRKMNSNYAKHLKGEISSCARCKGLKLN
jgi:hypothetical protein